MKKDSANFRESIKAIIDSFVEWLNNRLLAFEKDIKAITDDSRSYNRTLQQYNERLASLEKRVALLEGKEIEKESREFRKQNGSSINEIGTQDIISSYKKLKIDCQEIATTIYLSTNSLSKELYFREFLKGKLSSIFIENISYEAWIVDLEKYVQKIDKNFRLDDTNVKLLDFYAAVEDLKIKNNRLEFTKFSSVKNGEIYDRDFQKLSTDKCRASGQVAFLVFPGFFRGDYVEEKAEVFTSIDD